jgi:hypothetical protein
MTMPALESEVTEGQVADPLRPRCRRVRCDSHQCERGAQDLLGTADRGDASVPKADEVPGCREAAVPVRTPPTESGRRSPAGSITTSGMSRVQLRDRLLGEAGEHCDHGNRSHLQYLMDPGGPGLAAMHLRETTGSPSRATSSTPFTISKPHCYRAGERQAPAVEPASRASSPLIAVRRIAASTRCRVAGEIRPRPLMTRDCQADTPPPRRLSDRHRPAHSSGSRDRTCEPV